MVMMGEPVTNVTALDALLGELYASTGHVAFLRQALANLSQDELGTPYGVAVTSLYNTERDRKTKIARLAIESGVDEAAIRVAEVQVSLLGQALARAADTAGLDPAMRAKLGQALRQELAATDAQPHSLAALSAGRTAA
jgi:DNA-binding XRE family transcriptional regulator